MLQTQVLSIVFEDLTPRSAISLLLSLGNGSTLLPHYVKQTNKQSRFFKQFKFSKLLWSALLTQHASENHAFTI